MLECIVVVTTVCGVQSVVQEVSELQQQLRRKEAELTRAEETIRREQQQIMRQLVCTCKGSPLGFPFHTFMCSGSHIWEV